MTVKFILDSGRDTNIIGESLWRDLKKSKIKCLSNRKISKRIYAYPSNYGTIIHIGQPAYVSIQLIQITRTGPLTFKSQLKERQDCILFVSASSLDLSILVQYHVRSFGQMLSILQLIYSMHRNISVLMQTKNLKTHH